MDLCIHLLTNSFTTGEATTPRPFTCLSWSQDPWRDELLKRFITKQYKETYTEIKMVNKDYKFQNRVLLLYRLLLHENRDPGYLISLYLPNPFLLVRKHKFRILYKPVKKVLELSYGI